MMALRRWACVALVVCVAAEDVIVDPKHDNSHLTVCTSDSDCTAQRFCSSDGNYVNETDGTPLSVCLHKELFSDFSGRDLATMITVFVCTILASAAGIGGGGLLTPTYIMIGGFLIQEATPLSHATVMGNAVAQLVINFPKRHPYVEEPGKPLIDYAAPLLLLPPQLAGNALGVLLNPMFPPNLLIGVAELLLAFAIYKVFSKAMKYYKEERTEDKAETIAIVAGDDGAGIDGSQYGSLGQARRASLSFTVTEDQEAVIEAESKVPKKYVLLMAAFWVLFACIFVGMKLAGTCTDVYWVLFCLLYPVVLAFVYVGVGWMKEQNAERAKCGLPPVRGSLSLDRKTLIVAPTLACGVGLVAGMLGLGGGELMAPLLLELGMVPKVASATSAYMIVWTTSSDIIHYITTEDLDPQYTPVFFTIALAGALLGRHYGLVLVQKYNRQSAIAFVLGVLLIVSMVLFFVRALQSPAEHPWWPFNNPCAGSG